MSTDNYSTRLHENLATLGLITPTLAHLVKFTPDAALLVHRTHGTPDKEHSWSASLVVFLNHYILDKTLATATGPDPQAAINSLELELVTRNPDEALAAYRQFWDTLDKVPLVPLPRYHPHPKPAPEKPSTLWHRILNFKHKPQ